MRKAFSALTAIVAISLASHVMAGDTAAQVGSAAPAFSLEDQDGKKISLADYKDKIVVLEWTNPGCPVVQRHYKAKTMTTLATKYADKGVVWLAINSTNTATNATNKEWVTEQKLSYPVLNDASGSTGIAYGAKTTPHMFVIDKTGKLVYAGGIDNDPKGNADAPVNYVGKALDELLAGKAVTTSTSKAYGCSVKFKVKD
jgi:peroxiredoxin